MQQADAKKTVRPLMRRAQAADLTADEMLTRFEWLAVDETCQVLRVGRTTLHRLFATKQLIALKIGGRTVVRSKDTRRKVLSCRYSPANLVVSGR